MLDRIVSEALFLAANQGDPDVAWRYLDEADPLLRPLLRRRLQARLRQVRAETVVAPTAEGEAHLLRLAALRASGDLPRRGAGDQAGYRHAAEAISPGDELSVARLFNRVSVLHRPRPQRWFCLSIALVVAVLGGAGILAHERHGRVPAAHPRDRTPLTKARNDLRPESSACSVT